MLIKQELNEEIYDYTVRKHYPKYAPRSRDGIIMVAFLMAIIYPTTTGMESSIIGTINSLQQYTDYFNLNDHTLGLNSAATWIGYFLSCPFIQQFCDYFGRKRTIFLSVWIMLLGIALAAGAQNTAMFVMGRIIIGLSAGCMAGGSNTLIGELSPPHLRGIIMGLYHSAYYVGALIASGITYGTRDMQNEYSWRIPTMTQIIPVILCLFMMIFCPESPRWLVLKGRTCQAKEIIYVLEEDQEKTEELIKEIQNSLVVERITSKSKGVYRAQIKTKANLHRMLICLSLALMCELAGSSIATYYFSILLNSAGVTDVKTQLQVAIIRSSFCFVCALTGCYTFDIIGRKVQALISMAGIIVCMFILGALVKVYGESDNNSGKYGAIAMMFMFSGFYAYCFTPLLSLYPLEVYPNASRLAGITVFNLCDYSAGIFGTFMLPIGMSNMGWKFYILTAAYDFLFIPVIYFTWVETKNMKLEDIPKLFGETADVLVTTELVDSKDQSDLKV